MLSLFLWWGLCSLDTFRVQKPVEQPDSWASRRGSYTRYLAPRHTGFVRIVIPICKAGDGASRHVLGKGQPMRWFVVIFNTVHKGAFLSCLENEMCQKGLAGSRWKGLCRAEQLCSFTGGSYAVFLIALEKGTRAAQLSPVVIHLPCLALAHRECEQKLLLTLV